MNPFFIRILAMSAAVAVAAWLTDIRCDGPLPALAVGTLLALTQVIVRPALIAASLVAFRRVSLPLLMLLFFGTNVFIFWTVGFIVPGFHVAKLSSALGGSLITGIVGFFIHTSLRVRLRGGLPSSFPIKPGTLAAEPERSEDGMKQVKGREIR